MIKESNNPINETINDIDIKRLVTFMKSKIPVPELKKKVTAERRNEEKVITLINLAKRQNKANTPPTVGRKNIVKII